MKDHTMALGVIVLIVLAVFVLELIAIRAGIDGKCLIAAIATMSACGGYVVRLLVENRKQKRGSRESKIECC